jgi:aminoglycoside phosphotransferase (APT) family kinase protein
MAVAVADALVDALARRYGAPVELAAPVTSSGDGFDSDIYFVQLAGPSLPAPWRAPLVLRVKGSVEQVAIAHREAAIQDWLTERGYPTPRVLALFEPGELVDTPAQVMERAPGVTMLHDIQRAPWRARRRIAELAALHGRLHAMDPDGFPVGDDLLDRRLQLVRRTADELDDPVLRDALRRVDGIADRLRDAPGAVCHGDFHPMNVIVSGPRAVAIDWTDAGVGDRHGDVARTLLLFDIAAVAASNAVERLALRAVGPTLGRWYRRSYAAGAPLDEARIALWTPVHLLHGWSQVRGLHAGQFTCDGTDDRAARVPASFGDELQQRFEVALEAAVRP